MGDPPWRRSYGRICTTNFNHPPPPPPPPVFFRHLSRSGQLFCVYPRDKKPAAHEEAAGEIRQTELFIAYPEILSFNAGMNSRMSSIMPTSATWKIGALGFLLTATMKGDPLMPPKCWKEPLIPMAM